MSNCGELVKKDSQLQMAAICYSFQKENMELFKSIFIYLLTLNIFYSLNWEKKVEVCISLIATIKKLPQT